MSSNFQSDYQNSSFIKDATETSTIPITNEYFTESHMAELANEIQGQAYAMGLPGLRTSTLPVWGSNTSLGLATSSLTSIVFVSTVTLATGELVGGQANTSTGWRRITAGGTGQTFSVNAAFDVDLTAETAVSHGTVSDRFGQIVPRGSITGRLSADAGTNFGLIDAGDYEINGVLLRASSPATISSVFGSLTLETSAWYNIAVDRTGNAYAELGIGTVVTGPYSITAIDSTFTSTEISLPATTTTDLSGVTVGTIFAALDPATTTNAGLFRVTAYDDTAKTISTFPFPGTLDQAAAGGLLTIYWGPNDQPIGTTTTESYNPAPAFSDSLVGYYSTFTTTSRIIGQRYIDSSSATTHSISYGAGRNKNDNSFFAHTYLAYGSTDTRIVRFNTTVRNWGSDYTVGDTAANGHTWTFNRSGKLSVTVWIYTPTGAVQHIGISLNSTELTTDIDALTNADDRVGYAMDFPHAGGNGCPCAKSELRIGKGDVVRVHTAGAVPSDANFCGVEFVFTPD